MGVMKSNTPKLIAIGLLVPFTGVAFYLVLQLRTAVNEVPDRLIPEPEAKVEEHGGGHEEAKADAHGGGHGAPAADAHGAPAADAHGAPAADAHGAPAADSHGGGGHGESAENPGPGGGSRGPASVGLFSVDEVFVNVGFGGNVKSLGLKIELEIFEEATRQLFEQNVSGVRHTVIEASRQQDADRLQTVAGKLYFKEYLVTRLNGFFKRPVVREVHFSSFYLQ